MVRTERARSSERTQSGLTRARDFHRGGPDPEGQASDLGPERLIEIQRARLLTAIVTECAERGAANVTVAHIVARAGVSRRTFYEIFRDCEECFLAALDGAIARASRCVLDAYEQKAAWVERIRACVAAILSFLEAERAAGELLIVGSFGMGAEAQERRLQVLTRIVNTVDQGRGESKAAAELPQLTAEGVVGGAISIIHARLLQANHERLTELAAPLTSMVVLPYLGPAAARRELTRPTPKATSTATGVSEDPLRDLGMRLTYRTVRVLLAIAAHPGRSNRELGLSAGISDQGQVSKLLGRLERLGLIENKGLSPGKGAPNAWTLTATGRQVEHVIDAEGAERNGLASARSGR